MKLMNILKFGPGAHGRHRKRRKLMEARASQFTFVNWSNDGTFARRNYASYTEYLAHQAQKLDGITERLKNREDHDFDQFKQRFENCSWLADAHCVLCLGARLGTEVRALRALGHFAVGIDLNPGPRNASVMYGDFHHVDFPDGSVDAIYTNALDHAFDLDKLLGEVHRLLRPNGVFVVDMVVGFAEGYPPGDFESLAWSDTETLIKRICECSQFAMNQSRNLAGASSSLWRQVVFSRSPLHRPCLSAEEPQRVDEPSPASQLI